MEVFFTLNICPRIGFTAGSFATVAADIPQQLTITSKSLEISSNFSILAVLIVPPFRINISWTYGKYLHGSQVNARYVMPDLKHAETDFDYPQLQFIKLRLT